MAEDLGEKTEAPTGRRLADARERGSIAKSQDLSAAIDLIAGVLLIAIFGGALLRAFAGVMRHVLATPSETLNARALGGVLRSIAWESMLAVAPILGMLVVVAIGAQLVQVGFVFSTTPLEPKWERLNPFVGFGKIFNRRNGVRTVTSVVKLVVMSLVAWVYVRSRLGMVAGLPLLTTFAGVAVIGRLIMELLAWLLAVMLIIGAADYLYQRWQHTRDLRMSKEEVKDERRSMDGDPTIKGKRLKMMRDMAVQRINAAVPKADVIVTNPTHYSVAIRYDSDTMRSPRVVAKGVDAMAMRIRQVAMIHKVPIVERPPLARGLYFGVEVGQEIKPEFYQAVAELLAYVYRLEKAAA